MLSPASVSPFRPSSCIARFVHVVVYAGSVLRMYAPGFTAWYASVTVLTPFGSVTLALITTFCPAVGWSGACATCRICGGAVVLITVLAAPGVAVPRFGYFNSASRKRSLLAVVVLIN